MTLKGELIMNDEHNNDYNNNLNNNDNREGLNLNSEGINQNSGLSQNSSELNQSSGELGQSSGELNPGSELGLSSGEIDQSSSEFAQSTGSDMNHTTPEVNDGKKMKKKRKVFGVLKFGAAALILGLIAGAAFQGYFMIMRATGHEAASSQSSNTVTEVAKDSSNSDGVAVATSGSTSSNDVVTDVSDIVKKVMPSIVAINCKATATSTDIFGRSYSEDSSSSGSGIIIGQNSSRLLIVTNNHVIDGATSVKVTFSDNKTASAEIKGSDSTADLALLSVNLSDLKESTLKTIKVATLGDSSSVEAGDLAIAIGNALGYGQSVTVGYISAVNREVTINENTMKLLQTDAAINPGNSGGALINSKGQVIGINSVKYASEDVEGMGYAIPISTAVPMINELMTRTTVSSSEKGYLGINADTAQEVTKDYSERFNMPVGVYVNDVIQGSPADKAGLVQGDIITGVDNTKISTVDDLVNALSYKKAGQQISLKIQVKSNGNYVKKTLKVTLGKKN